MEDENVFCSRVKQKNQGKRTDFALLDCCIQSVGSEDFVNTIEEKNKNKHTFKESLYSFYMGLYPSISINPRDDESDPKPEGRYGYMPSAAIVKNSFVGIRSTE